LTGYRALCSYSIGGNKATTIFDNSTKENTMKLDYDGLINKIALSLSDELVRGKKQAEIRAYIEKMPLLIKYSSGSEYRGSLSKAYGEDLKYDALNPHDHISKVKMGKTCDGDLQIVLHVKQRNFVALVQTSEILFLRVEVEKKDARPRGEYYSELFGKNWKYDYMRHYKDDVWFIALYNASEISECEE
jgi:hypothetical protein